MNLIRHSQNQNHLPFTTIRGGKDNLLLQNEKELLKQLSDTLTVIHGGQFKTGRRQA